LPPAASNLEFGRIHRTLRATPAMQAASRIMSGRWRKLRRWQR